jgi:hypothetical protein
MLGEPTTPPFSIGAFISSEANQVRAFATSATSWRITTSFWSSARRNTLPFVSSHHTGCLLLQLRAGGAVPEGSYCNFNGRRIQGLRALNEALHLNPPPLAP